MTDPLEIHHGDCVTAIRKWRIGKREPPTLIFADPPYNTGVDYGGGASADRLDRESYVCWTFDWIGACAGWLAEGGSLWVLAPEEWVEAISCAAFEANLTRRRWIVWHENFGVYCKRNFGRCARHLLYYVKGTVAFTWNPDAVRVESARQRAGDKRATGPKIMGNVWTIPRVCGTHAEKVKDMPNQLPLELLRRVVMSTSNPGDLVFDPFCGTGTTGVACAMGERRFLGADTSEKACAVSKKRWTDASFDWFVRAASEKGVNA